MIPVLIVHKNAVLAAGLCMLLRTGVDLQVAGEGDENIALDLAAALAPHVALVDADSCQDDGLAVVRLLRAACPRLAIVVLGLRDDPETQGTAVLAGACCYVPKQEPEKMLAEVRRWGG